MRTIRFDGKNYDWYSVDAQSASEYDNLEAEKHILKQRIAHIEAQQSGCVEETRKFLFNLKKCPICHEHKLPDKYKAQVGKNETIDIEVCIDCFSKPVSKEKVNIWIAETAKSVLK